MKLLLLAAPFWEESALTAPNILEDGRRRFDVTGRGAVRKKKKKKKKKLFPHLAHPHPAEEVYFGQGASRCQRRHGLWGVNC